MSNSIRRSFLVIAVLLLVFSSWFGWMSFSFSRTQWIESKVNLALSSSLQRLVPQWPRMQVHSDLVNGVYYSPVVNDQALVFQLYRQTLEYLNQDESVPPVKVSRVMVRNEYGAVHDNLIIQATVEFPLVAGFEKIILVQDTVVVQHYVTPH
jgi:hypothetical protein